MSNWIVCKGLGGVLEVTRGLGAEGVIPPAGNAILHVPESNLRIQFLLKNNRLYLFYRDTVNRVWTEISATADQKAGKDWIFYNVSRSGNSLVIRIGREDAITIPLVAAPDYTGTAEVMDGFEAEVFDYRIIPRAVSKEAFEYYLDDIDENAGKALLPNR